MSALKIHYIPDYNAITAWATLAAVLVALFLEPLRRWRNAPKLRVALRRRDADSVELNPALEPENSVTFYRLLVTNSGRQAASNVEAIVTDLYEYRRTDGQNFKLVQGFVATPLNWTHSELSKCEQLPARSERLCNLGIHQNLSERNGARDEFVLATSITPKSGYNRLGPGHFVARIIVSGIDCKSAELVLEFKLARMVLGGPDVDEFSVRPASRETIQSLQRAPED
jgi:hypothetical protein